MTHHRVTVVRSVSAAVRLVGKLATQAVHLVTATSFQHTCMLPRSLPTSTQHTSHPESVCQAHPTPFIPFTQNNQETFYSFYFPSRSWAATATTTVVTQSFCHRTHVVRTSARQVPHPAGGWAALRGPVAMSLYCNTPAAVRTAAALIRRQVTSTSEIVCVQHQ